MALTKLDKNLNIVSALDNEPNDVSGMTADDLKAKFDEGNKAIQEYINETLITETEEAIAAVAGRADEVREELKEDMESLATKQELRGVVLGQIPNGTITEEKLDPEFVNSQYSKDEIISAGTKDEFGLPETATPDDAFAKLANVSDQYVWHKTKTTEWYDQIVSNPFSVSICTNNNVAYTIRYADSVSVDADGKAVLVEPITAATYSYATFDSVVGVAAIRGKYITTESEDTIASYGEGAVFYIPHDATSSTSNNRSIYVGCQWVKYEYHSKTEDFGYVSSPLFDDYPPIKPDGFDYAYVGKTPESANLVGDVKVTIRNDLGEKWLPCDGRAINLEELPDLAKIVDWKLSSNMTQGNYCIDPVMFSSGNTVVIAGQENTNYIRFTYSLDGYATNSGNKSYAIQSSYVYPRGIYCYNGVWCLVARSDNGHEVYYTTDVTSDKKWTKYILPSGEPFSIYCHNGLWVISGRTSRNSAEAVACIWTSTDPTAGADSWTQYTFNSGAYSQCDGAFYHQGKWVISSTTNLSRSTHILRVYVSDNIPSNEWVESIVIDQTSIDMTTYAYGLFAYDGVWAITSIDRNYYTRIFYATNPAEEWSFYDPPIPSLNSTSVRGKSPSSIYCKDGLWAYCEYVQQSNSNLPYFRTTTDVAGGVWTEDKINDNLTPKTTLVTAGGVMVAGQGPSSSFQLRLYKKYKAVPTISVEGANTFIKAKM